jgi:hypothetical protein
MANEVTVILKNAGGITLQVAGDSGRYQRTYETREDKAAYYAIEALQGADAAQWQGNDEKSPDGQDNWLSPSDAQIRNGTYRVYRVETPEELQAALKNTSWTQEQELEVALDTQLSVEAG